MNNNLMDGAAYNTAGHCLWEEIWTEHRLCLYLLLIQMLNARGSYSKQIQNWILIVSHLQQGCHLLKKWFTASRHSESLPYCDYFSVSAAFLSNCMASKLCFQKPIHPPFNNSATVDVRTETLLFCRLCKRSFRRTSAQLYEPRVCISMSKKPIL